MANVGAEHPEDDVFGNVRRMVGDALEVAGDEEGIERLLRDFRLLVCDAYEDYERLIALPLECARKQ